MLLSFHALSFQLLMPLFQVVEHGLGHLPFTEKQVVTPTGRRGDRWLEL
jgi:hypothetical protein